jgi:hypothetical protein
MNIKYSKVVIKPLDEFNRFPITQISLREKRDK